MRPLSQDKQGWDRQCPFPSTCPLSCAPFSPLVCLQMKKARQCRSKGNGQTSNIQFHRDNKIIFIQKSKISLPRKCHVHPPGAPHLPHQQSRGSLPVPAAAAAGVTDGAPAIWSAPLGSGLYQVIIRCSRLHLQSTLQIFINQLAPLPGQGQKWCSLHMYRGEEQMQT